MKKLSEQPWNACTFVAFDIETSGAWPLGEEVCEFGAVKWQNGVIIDKIDTLIKPKKQMSEEIIKIHGITNEMVQSAPEISQVIRGIRNFFDGAVSIAHHAPFDLGFMALEFEKAGLTLPIEPVLCTSLLTIKLFPKTKDHKLKTMLEFFDIQRANAHRGYDDALACLEVAMKCFEKQDAQGNGATSKIEDMQKVQVKPLAWQNYSLLTRLDEPVWDVMIEGVRQQKTIEIIYQGGSVRDAWRPVIPLGIVRSPDGDWLSAFCKLDQQKKRFTIEKIKRARRS